MGVTLKSLWAGFYLGFVLLACMFVLIRKEISVNVCILSPGNYDTCISGLSLSNKKVM